MEILSSSWPVKYVNSMRIPYSVILNRLVLKIFPRICVTSI
jgi:hypothetical protein